MYTVEYELHYQFNTQASPLKKYSKGITQPDHFPVHGSGGGGGGGGVKVTDYGFHR